MRVSSVGRTFGSYPKGEGFKSPTRNQHYGPRINMKKKNKIYFGRIAVGKSTVVRKIHGDNFVDCDRAVWDYFSDDPIVAGQEFVKAIESGDKTNYERLLKWFAARTNFAGIFSEDTNYEVSVFGNYYNLGVLPSFLIEDFDLVKVTCDVDSRIRNVNERGLDWCWVTKCDYLHEDPDVNFETIRIEDF